MGTVLPSPVHSAVSKVRPRRSPKASESRLAISKYESCSRATDTLTCSLESKFAPSVTEEKVGSADPTPPPSANHSPLLAVSSCVGHGSGLPVSVITWRQMLYSPELYLSLTSNPLEKPWGTSVAPCAPAASPKA